MTNPTPCSVVVRVEVTRRARAGKQCSTRNRAKITNTLQRELKALRSWKKKMTSPIVRPVPTGPTVGEVQIANMQLYTLRMARFKACVCPQNSSRDYNKVLRQMVERNSVVAKVRFRLQ